MNQHQIKIYNIINWRLMDSSQDQGFKNDSQEFITHKQTKQHKKELPNVYRSRQIAQICMKKHQRILKNAAQQFTEQIIQQINVNFKGLIQIKEPQQKQQNQDKNKKQSKKLKKDDLKKNKSLIKQQNSKQQIQRKERQLKFQKSQKLILPICVRKSQQDYIQKFMNHLQKRLQKFKKKQQKQAQNDQQSQNQQGQVKKNKKQNQRHQKNYNVFESAEHINFFIHKPNQNNKKDSMSRDNHRSVTSIALYIHQRMKQFHVKGDMTIYLSPVVTDLNPSNIYILQQGLADFYCILIIPTFNSFQDALYSRIAKNQIIPFKLFQHKHLFSQLMYECICDPEIMGYLPKKSLKLLDDFQDFPITYIEGTHRLIYCLQRLQFLRQRRNIKFRHVDIKALLEVIQYTFKRVFKFFHNKQSTIKKYVKCILDEQQIFNILDKYLNKIDYFKRQQQNTKNEIQLVTQIRLRLIKYIERQDSIKELSRFFKQNPAQKTAKNRKNKDKEMQRYQVDSQLGMDQKNLFQYQIRLAITHLTDQIRNFANNFSWQEFNFIQRVKPMFPYDLFGVIGKLSPKHCCLVQFIYDKISTPLITIISNFCGRADMEYGQLMYYIKDLQLYGLIDISQSSLNPIITPTFFQKASYRTRNIG